MQRLMISGFVAVGLLAAATILLRSVKRAARRDSFRCFGRFSPADRVNPSVRNGGMAAASSGAYLFVARSRNCTSAARSCSEPMRCSGILVPGVYAEGPISNNLATVSGVQTISRRLSASEKL